MPYTSILYSTLLIYLCHLPSSSLCLFSSSYFVLLVHQLDLLVHLVLVYFIFPCISYSSSCMSQILDMTCYNYMFIIIMFIAYFDCMFSIVGLALCLRPCSYSAYSVISGVGGRSCVSVVLRQCLFANAPNVPSHVVDRKGDSFVESYVVHSLHIGLVRSSCGVMSCYVPNPP